MNKSAIIKEPYRYSLKRQWDDFNLNKVTFVLLNPSTADENIDDRTTQRCLSFAKKQDCGSLEIVNLFAYRSRDWQELKDLSLEEATGPENQFYIETALYSSAKIIVGWGENCKIHYKDYNELSQWFKGYSLYCLGTTAEGHPKHPLFVKSTTELIPYEFPIKAERPVQPPQLD